jgi:hypothetical protein
MSGETTTRRGNHSIQRAASYQDLEKRQRRGVPKTNSASHSNHESAVTNEQQQQNRGVAVVRIAQVSQQRRGG